MGKNKETHRMSCVYEWECLVRERGGGWDNSQWHIVNITKQLKSIQAQLQQ